MNTSFRERVGKYSRAFSSRTKVGSASEVEFRAWKQEKMLRAVLHVLSNKESTRD